MRCRRTLTSLLALALVAAALAGTAPRARAQSVDDAEQTASKAKEQAGAAAGLVDTAIAERSEIETELAASMVRLNELAEQLSSVAAGVDRLQGQIGFADAELSGIESDIEVQAVDAYMTALSVPGITFVNSDNVEDAMVTGLFVGDVISSGQEKVDELVMKRRNLEALVATFLAEQEKVAELNAQVDAEVENLARLYEEADAGVAEAIREAGRSAAEYSAALSAVDAAQAREAEQERQNGREPQTATIPDPPDNSTTSTTTIPVTTTTGGSGGGGGQNFPPAVERWRDEVRQFFPSSRVDEALAIIQCESMGDSDAYNPYSGASGLFQFLPSTWAATAPKAGFGGASPFDGVANIGTAAWLGNQYEDLGLGFWKPWSCRRVLN
ncbi:MAG TPA: transglycosylase SLT domain-containing protein [Acidimicrobiia bacterium]|nr:transglycosylase SLT domain-containing protein [Acidimicrobiia bacterium]